MIDTKHIRRDFHSATWVMHALGVGLGVLRGQKILLPIRPLWYLLLNDWTQLNLIWCVSYSHKWGVQQQKKEICSAPWGPGGGVKRSNIIKYQ